MVERTERPRPSRLLALGALLALTTFAIACGGQESSDAGGELAPGTLDEVPPVTETEVVDPSKLPPPPTDLDEILALFPADLPKWEAATLTDAVAGREGEGVQALDTDASAADARSFYRRELEAQGWTLAMEKSAGEFVTLHFARGNDELSVLVEPKEEGGTKIHLVNR